MRAKWHGLMRLWREPGEALRDWLLARYPIGANLTDPRGGGPIVKVAIGSIGESVLARFLEMLNAAGLGYMVGGADRWSRAVHLHENDRARALGIIEELLGYQGESLRVRLPKDFNARPNQTHRLGYIELRPVERTSSETRLMACSEIGVYFWVREISYSTEEFCASPIPNSAVNRLRVKTFDSLCARRASLDGAVDRSQYVVNFPVDAVFTWVDDHDEAWRASREEFTPPQSRDDHRSNHNERFRNHDELRYSLRSLEMFAPFVRHVFLVTNGQTPEWLNRDCERLTVVPHSEIFSHKEYLPTFNSSGIEAQLHRISGLSEHFLYFNDDFFLGDFCVPEDFFFANGALKFFPSSQFVFDEDIDLEREAYILADYNALQIVRQSSGGRGGSSIMQHVPYPCSRVLLESMERQWPASFDAVARERFRSPNDIRPIAFLQYHAGFLSRMAFPSNIGHTYLPLWNPLVESRMRSLLRNRDSKTICINDVGVDDHAVESAGSMVRSFLHDYFPFPSEFER